VPQEQRAYYCPDHEEAYVEITSDGLVSSEEVIIIEEKGLKKYLCKYCGRLIISIIPGNITDGDPEPED
jgi:hypothetical protein